MDSLIAQANAAEPAYKRRKYTKKRPSIPDADDHTLHSVIAHTNLPKSLRPASPPPEDKQHAHIANKKLRTQLNRTSAQTARSKVLIEDAELLLAEESGMMEVEGEMERTWRVGQDEIVKAAGQEAAKGRREWKLDGGPYRSRYTRNGRHLAIAGRTGHVATFDWQTGQLHAELQLQETCRDITFLHDHSHFAVAQKKYVFIYDRDGVELHCLKAHLEPTRLEFLPYHWLLASIGNTGHLRYQDTSTGQLLTTHATKLGSCSTMTQNPHTAVIHLGHTNGCITLWTPNLPHPAVQILGHVGGVMSVAVDPSHEGGRYMGSMGVDGTVKIWDCRNWKGSVREWRTRGAGMGGGALDWSARGALGVASGGTVNVYTKPAIHTPHSLPSPPPLYLTHPVPHRPITSLRFTPFQDVLTIGHASGLSTILVPGSGEPNFDSTEADPFENKKARREREVRGLLDKIQPDMISLNPDFVGSIAPPSKLTVTGQVHIDGKPSAPVPFARLSRLERLKVQGKADEGSDDDDGSDDEGGAEGTRGNGKKEDRAEREKRKMRGKGKSMKRYLRKQRKNVIDPKAIAVRAKLEKQKEERQKAKAAAEGLDTEPKKPSALDRFKRS